MDSNKSGSAVQASTKLSTDQSKEKKARPKHDKKDSDK